MSFIGFNYDELIRVGCRLRHSNLPTFQKQFMLLPKSSHLAKLIICYWHLFTFKIFKYCKGQFGRVRELPKTAVRGTCRKISYSNKVLLVFSLFNLIPYFIIFFSVNFKCFYFPNNWRIESYRLKCRLSS